MTSLRLALALGMVVGGASLGIGHWANAAPRPVPQPGVAPVRPPIGEAPLSGSPRIVAFRRGEGTYASTKYVNGPIDYTLDFANPGLGTISGKIRVDRYVELVPGNTPTPSFLTEVNLSAPSGVITSVTFRDSTGITNGCREVRYRFSLSGVVNTGKVTPGCTFQVSTVGPPQPPQTTDVVYYHSPQLTKTPRCDQKWGAGAVVVNARSEPMTVLLDFGGTDSAAFTLQAGAYSTVQVERPRFDGVAGTFGLQLQRPADSLGGGLGNQLEFATAPGHWSAKVTRKCSAQAALE